MAIFHLKDWVYKSLDGIEAGVFLQDVVCGRLLAPSKLPRVRIRSQPEGPRPRVPQTGRL